MRTITTTIMSYDEFDKLVNDNYPVWNKQYESVPENEWNNYSDYMYDNVDGTDNDCELNERDDFRWNVDGILHDLVRRGILVPGNYTIEVSW